ncbi:MAG: hypothetical protein ACFFCM_16515, partial [Promethearchaeota archaeon]
MKKNKLLLLGAALIIPLILLFIPIQRVQAVGPNFIEGPDGYQITVSDSWTYNITTYNPSLNLNFTVGDLFRVRISKTNNSIMPLLQQPNPLGPWIADTAFG